MLDCQDLDFSTELAASRTEAAEAVFGKSVLRRIMVFALFLLGAKRAHISEALGMPPGTIRSLIRRLLRIGPEGFRDRRGKAGSETVVDRQQPPPALVVRVEPHTELLLIAGGQLELPAGNPAQRKVVLLSLIGAGMLSAEEVAPLLGLSTSHVRRLHRELMASDVQAVLDKRSGQLKDYRVDARLKGQIIVQCVLELAERGRASSAAVARRLNVHCNENVPERTIRHHLSRMGLTSLRPLLREGLGAIKKGSAR